MIHGSFQHILKGSEKNLIYIFFLFLFSFSKDISAQNLGKNVLNRGICTIQYTAIPYRVSTGPEHGFPCVVNSHMEKPVFITGNPCSIAGNLYSLQGFPCENQYTGRSLQSLQGMGLQCCNENRFFPVWEKYTGKTMFWPCTGTVRNCSALMLH